MNSRHQVALFSIILLHVDFAIRILIQFAFLKVNNTLMAQKCDQPIIFDYCDCKGQTNAFSSTPNLL